MKKLSLKNSADVCVRARQSNNGQKIATKKRNDFLSALCLSEWNVKNWKTDEQRGLYLVLVCWIYEEKKMKHNGWCTVWSYRSNKCRYAVAVARFLCFRWSFDWFSARDNRIINIDFCIQMQNLSLSFFWTLLLLSLSLSFHPHFCRIWIYKF